MSSLCLLDVNILVAVLDSAHEHHSVAKSRFRAQVVKGWATCPITENGFLRVVSGFGYPNLRLRPAQAADLLAQLKTNFASSHEFWADSVSLTDKRLFHLEALTGSKQLTGAYLAGLAHRHKARLATLDGHVPWQAVKGASAALVDAWHR